jgi:flagellum-specific peptidoglycan hydrolase FlgJ
MMIGTGRHAHADVINAMAEQVFEMTIPNEVIAAARAASKKWKVPASVSLAQWIIESGWGKHEPFGSNNPFGIKAGKGSASVSAPTHEFIHGRYVPTTARFAKFSSVAGAFDAHAKLIAKRPAYRHAMQATSAEQFAERLTGVYATDPNYGHKLVAAMREYGLEKYDTEA